MPSCLGIYVENNLIKYAKVSKEHEEVKVEAYGVNFYDKLDDAIKQIVSETYSYKIPVSVNLSNEKYTYFDLFSLLNKNDMEKAIKTEFDYYCEENGYNKNVLESRYLLTNNVEDKDKTTAIYVYANKTEVVKKLQTFENYKLTNLVPLGISISNLIENRDKKNSIIVNIEDKTTVTTIIGGEIKKINTIEKGMANILDNINLKENSYSKAYEICKNSTIYTMEGKELQTEENDYLEDIMPVLYNIVEEVRNIVTENSVVVDNIYITGLGSVINNVDLYFQEYFQSTKCEILKPYFTSKTNLKVNIKDYIEVNSAISLALQGLDLGIKDINFKTNKAADRFKELMKSDISFGKQKSGSSNKKSIDLNFSLSGKLDNIELILLRCAGGILVFIILYVIISNLLIGQIKSKNTEIEEVIADTNKQIATIDSDTGKLKTRTSQYQTLIKNLNDINDEITEKYKTKNSIPNLLSGIMFNIPKNVQITSIENTKDRHIVINLKTTKYEQIGMFKAALELDGTLVNVTSGTGVQQNGIVSITIEGDLP